VTGRLEECPEAPPGPYKEGRARSAGAAGKSTVEGNVMTAAPQRVGRRERNKQEKLDRITAAARELFAEHGVDEVTTQQVAERADIGTGTLFLYAKTKGDLLLLAQNSTYADALEQGRAAAETAADTLAGVLAIVRPVVECNRKQVDNGRTYLREMVFGDPEEPHRQTALSLALQTEEAIAAVLARDPRTEPGTAPALAHVVAAIMFITMASPVNANSPVDDLLHEIAEQVRLLLPR
jgi:TetR/AcrR family transcriptional regulator